MKLIKGLLDYSTPWTLPNVYLFTGNPISRKDGALVMGRGAAKMVRDFMPRVPFLMAKKITENSRVIFTGCGLGNPAQYIGWFKVKEHWHDPALPYLIKESAMVLTHIAINRPDITFHMNMPGIGNGRLDIDTVHPLLQALPDNVLIYSTLRP
jgi:hypothetical protein